MYTYCQRQPFFAGFICIYGAPQYVALPDEVPGHVAYRNACANMTVGPASVIDGLKTIQLLGMEYD